jgi:hypothetical protein
MRTIRIFLSLIVLGTAGLYAQEKRGNEPVTTGSLFHEMINLQGLATVPDPVFRMVQFSSHDRRSVIPGGPGWFANADGFGEEPIPNFEKVLKGPDTSGVGEYLIADVDGPGAVVRLWTADISGKVRLYIDRNEIPLYDGDANEFFRRPYDGFPQINSINRDRFKTTVYQRDASYAPIPFARHLKVIWTGKIAEIHFYHLQVRLYSPGTRVASFSPGDIARYRETIDSVTLVLSDPDTYSRPPGAEREKPFTAVLGPSENKEMASLEGPGAAGRLVLQLGAEDLDRALRQTVLRIVCDGYPEGQVESPVGDFFGAAPGINPFQSLPFTIRPDGTMVCRFVMPFEKSFRIILDNRGTQSVSVRGSVLPVPFVWKENSMHFRARWRVNHNLIASDSEVMDLPFLIANGGGVYVGTAAFIMNPSPIPTPWGNWWGEGDEKVFIDDGALPSLFGTGSEDYFNYSWSAPDIFFFPYCGQPRNDGPGNRGFVTNFRWHILDPIPFVKNIRFFMELNSHERTPGLSYARIGYHYARPGTTDDHVPIMPEDLRPLRLPAGWMPAARFGARNSVFYQAEDILRDRENTRVRNGDLWAGSKLLVWTPKKAGDRKDFIVQINSGGTKQVHVTAALTPLSGKFSLLLDKQTLPLDNDTAVVDLNKPYRTLLRDFSFKARELKEGEHTLTIEFKGTTGLIERPEIGIDFFWVQKAE